MRTAKLDALEIEVPLRWNQFYQDHGYVDSVEDYRKRLEIKHKGFYIDELFAIMPERFGECRSLNKGVKGILFFVDIYYLKMDSENLNVFFQGHEQEHASKALEYHKQKHASDELKSSDLLSKKILDEMNVQINLEEVYKSYGKEVSANIGGIYALSKRGMNLIKTGEELLELVGKSGYAYKSYKKALEIWEKAKLP